MMEKITNGHPLTQSPDFVKENLETLKKLFPTIVKEGKIDIEELQALLGNEVETEDEYYRFTWAGKSMARKEANKPSTGTLRPNKTDSKDWDTTQNIFIEGDNLEALKLLQKSYNGKIKVVCIDPPYNTGGDFVYKDNYADNLKNYLNNTGQLDEEGKKKNTNNESDGRYHSNWLNMMYPRLKLARNLMTEDGVIFISIDDNEVSNLKKICDEIFGEDNFVAKFIHKNNSSKNQSKLVSVSTEYFLCYAKSKQLLNNYQWRIEKKGASDIAKKFKELANLGLDLEEIGLEIKEMYKRPKFSHLSRWNKVDEKGVFKDADLSREGGSKNYTIINPITSKECKIPERGWGKSYEELIRLQKEDLIWYGDENTPPGQKDYITEDDVSVPDNFWYYDNSIDTREIKKMFGVLIFENPKPQEMIQNILSLHSKNDDIVLDFFAGSGTTAISLLKLNSEDREKRKFICIQLPELIDPKSEAHKLGYMTIADITKNRIKKAGDKIIAEIGDDLFNAGGSKLDIGFRAFKLDSSNINSWDGSLENLESNLLNSVNNIKENRTEEDVLYEILLKYGLDLTLPIEEKIIAGKTVYNVGMGSLFICLANDITTAVAEGIGAWKKEQDPATCRVLFKDNGFTDVEKTNSIQVLKHYGIDEVNSI